MVPALPVSHCSNTEDWELRGTAVPALSAQEWPSALWMSSLLLLCAHLVLPAGRSARPGVTGGARAHRSGGTRAKKAEGCSSPQLCSQVDNGGKALLDGVPSAFDLPFPSHALHGDGVEFGSALYLH